MNRNHWYEAGLGHVWLPYTQMKTARPPLAAARTTGCRIVLADGRELALTLARRLAALLPGDLDRVFFSESGSVAVEIAMKMAQQYWINRGEPRKTKFIAFRGGYHGD